MNANLKMVPCLPPQPVATIDECFWAIADLLERGGSIGNDRLNISFDPEWEMNSGRTSGQYVLDRYINGRKQRTAHDSLREALDCVVNP